MTCNISKLLLRVAIATANSSKRLLIYILSAGQLMNQAYPS